MTKPSTVRFDRTGPAIVVDELAVTDPAVVAEAHFWAEGRRGPAVTSEALIHADLSNYVLQALAVGAQAIATAGGVQQSYDIKDLVTEVSERTQQSAQRAADATDAMVTKAAKEVATASEQTRKAIGEAAAHARKDFGNHVDGARRAFSAELQRLLGGENSEVTARLQPLVDRFGRDLVERSAKQSEELMSKVARQFDPADPTSVLSQQNRLLADQHKLLVESLTKEQGDLAGKVSELTTAVTVAHAARTAAGATARLTPLKGDTYAGPVHRVLESIAAGLGDDYADTSATAGAISQCKKGDGLLTVEGGEVRVVIEMSDSVRGTGWGPYLAEAERNRGALASIGLVRSAEQLNGNSMITLGARRIVLAYDPEVDSPDLLRTVVQLSRLAAVATARSNNSGEIHAAQEKIDEALVTLGKIDAIDRLASQISKGAIKISGESGGLRTELTRLLKQAAAALAGAKTEGDAPEAAA